MSEYEISGLTQQELHGDPPMNLDDIESWELSADGFTQVELGNGAYYERLEKVISAATGGRKIDWTAVGLGIVMDREIRRAEAARSRQ